MRRLSTRSRGDTLFLGWETPRSWSIGRCNTTPRLCCEICCDSLFLFPPLCCGQWGRGLSRGLALAAASGPSVAGLEAAPGTALRGCSGNAAGRPPPPPPSTLVCGNLGFPSLAALGDSSPPGSQCVMGLSAPLGKAGSAGWRVGMICSFSVQTTNILFSHLEFKGAWLHGSTY